MLLYIDESQATWSIFLIRFYDYIRTDLKVPLQEALNDPQIIDHIISNYEIALTQGFDVGMDEGDFSELWKEV